MASPDMEMQAVEKSVHTESATSSSEWVRWVDVYTDGARTTVAGTPALSSSTRTCTYKEDGAFKKDMVCENSGQGTPITQYVDQQLVPPVTELLDKKVYSAAAREGQKKAGNSDAVTRLEGLLRVRLFGGASDDASFEAATERVFPARRTFDSVMLAAYSF